ncbi:hypothetical protein BN000_01409 [Neobacillus massiliamazoniensis]|uniref:Uncharacterized protein n=1 Tax=Neobacillus massiliamazoniensis TaxID=1499688 RepID=A0A0U1NU58_9BACI|nr:hypothetical protein BN000_01409 [Neobacillus massiliamazoniensis]
MDLYLDHPLHYILTIFSAIKNDFEPKFVDLWQLF